jgi:hypothetical protein
MTQWGSQDLGKRGYSTIEILRYYYGESLYIATAEEVSGVPSSYPGYDLEVGSYGEAVLTIQEQLNTITKYFTFDINGMTIGEVDNPYKVTIDNDRYSMTENGVEVFNVANGKVYSPEMKFTKTFEFLDYLAEKDENGFVSIDYVGGDD